MDLCMRHKRGGGGQGGGGLNNSPSSPYSLYPAGSDPSMPHLRLDWKAPKAPWQPLGSGVTGKGCFYLLMRSLPGAPSPYTLVEERGAAVNACRVTPLPSSVISRLQRMGWVTGIAHIWPRPVEMITNGSEIAGPQTGSSLSNECSHANPQSPHKRLGRSSRLLRFRRLMCGLHTSMVCVALHTLAHDLSQSAGPERHEQTV